MALLLASILLMLACSAYSCLLPPHGCKKETCDSLVGMVIPANAGDFGLLSTWQRQASYRRIAFIRASFNKFYANVGPGILTPESWLALLKGFNGKAGGPPILPSLNYEFYTLDGSEYVEAPRTVSQGTGLTYSPYTSVDQCCHGCRLAESCAMFAFVPAGTPLQATSVAGGTCYYLSEGVETRDGPFDFINGTDQYSKRTNNLKSPKTLTRSQTARALRRPASFPNYKQMFLGGYCNPHTYPNGTVTDDPHFTGAHGTRFDFNGELNKAFCLLTDKGLTVNALLKGYKSDNTFGATENADGKALRSWIKEVGLMWKGESGTHHTLHLVARAGKEQSRGDGFLTGAVLDGDSLPIPKAPGSSVTAGDLKLTFVNTFKKGRFDIDKFQVSIGSRIDLHLSMRVAHPKLQTPNNAEVHFNLMVNNVKVTDKVHGVLGQTYRNTPSQVTKAIKFQELSRLMGAPVKADGESGAGFLEGSVKDYEASAVLKPDCKVSVYDL